MADESKIRMNLAAIKRVDPYAKDIVDSTAHVAFYTFNSLESEWEKTDVEGAFFVYSRNAEPFHSIFINNRLNTTSFVEPITNHLELQSQPPFLLYRNERSRIRGFWFYSSSECDRIGELVTSLSQKCEIQTKLSISVKPNNVNIFNMLTKAQQEFNSKNTANDVSNIASHNVVKFFASAKPANFNDAQFMQRFFPKTLSVEQIEKQQRVKSPLNDNTTLANALQKFNSNIEQKRSAEIIDKPNEFANGESGIEVSSLSHFFNLTNTINQSNINIPDNLSDGRKSSTSKFLLENLPMPDTDSYKPALMPPTMFEKSVKFLPKTNVLTDMDANFEEKPLNQTQFIQAFSYLIKYDSDFKRKLHEAYLKSIAV